MKHNNIYDTLIERTITVIANLGLDKTTTKAIVDGTGINEVYIYRHFASKEDLLAKAFECLDQELVNKINQHISIMNMSGLDGETRSRLMFMSLWEFLVGNRERCLAFVRYHYSPYFQKYSYESHRVRFQPVVDKFSEVFIEEADVWMILSHILNIMLDFAVKVHHDQMPNNDDYVEHVFRVVYASIKQYFKK